MGKVQIICWWDQDGVEELAVFHQKEVHMMLSCPIGKSSERREKTERRDSRDNISQSTVKTFMAQCARLQLSRKLKGQGLNLILKMFGERQHQWLSVGHATAVLVVTLF